MLFSKTIVFTVPGEPQGKGRTRSAPIMRNGKPIIGAGGRPIVSNYTPAKTVAYEGLVAHIAQQAMNGRTPIAGPCMLSLDIRRSIPASWSTKKRARALAGALLPITKPDTSNILKAIEDGGNGVLWTDDKVIAETHITRRFAETPCVVVTIDEFDAEGA